ncbi:MAG: TonB-dependent receptor [Gammaproteobacteria bacterium]|nr:TonB-dependent receptor [Gammaproteobacteria bacterium]
MKRDLRYYLWKPALVLPALPLLWGAPAAHAQSAAGAIEEIVVTGIRSSLTRALDIKRNESGVVDAITAEEIGKFPDANLAESLQRITGVSIDRQNNEGNQISVRGLGPSFNLVTLNGRQMPVSSSPEQETISSATQSRAFNFAEIASESVAGVNVYKTARADVPTGGIGATVDIRTARPFDFSDRQAIVSASGIHDLSVESGDSVTPEIGGLFTTRLSDNFGVLVNGSYSRRDFADREEHHDGWQRLTPADNENEFSILGAVADLANVSQLYRPITNISEVSDNERERLNGQFVAQLRPNENVTATLDYTLSRFARKERRYQTGVFGDPANHGVRGLQFDGNGTFTSYSFTGAADFLSYENELRVENDSVGFNLAWRAGDALNLVFDLHSSESQSQPGGELNDLLFLLQGAQNVGFSYRYGGEPFRVQVMDSGASTMITNGVPGGLSSLDGSGTAETLPLSGFLDIAGLAPLGTFVRNISIVNEVDQAQLDGTWEMGGAGALQFIGFGASFTDFIVNTNSISSQFVFQGLGINPITFGAVCTAALCPGNSPLRSGIRVGSGSGVGGYNQILRVDSPAAIAGGFPIQTADIVPATDQSLIGEESLALHVNFNFEWEIGDMPAKLALGVRYETTDIEGTSVQNLPISLQTSSPTEQEVIQSTEAVNFTLMGEYGEVLPAVDFQVSPNDDVVARFSYGKTLARPDLNALRPALTIADTRPFGPFNAVRGNPDLTPYLADNIDLALEWYYSEFSYAAVNYFFKDIENYIGTTTVVQPILNVGGEALTDPSARFTGTPVVGTASDPVAQFNVLSPFNSGSARIDGFEFAVQHFFGETGFGVQANYTFVDSDAEFDPNAIEQTVNLIGLSDSANLVAFYEDDAFQIRAAYNWRGDFLFSENQLRVQNEPVFFDEYAQIDISSSWRVTDTITVFGEILNVTGEDQTQRGRFHNQFLFGNDQEPRVALGLRASIF